MILRQMFSTARLTPGQQQWTTIGTYSFLVPDYCYQIAAVAIGDGGPGSTSSSDDPLTGGGGGGGALSYSNAIPVTPLETLTVTNTTGDWTLKRGATVLLLAKAGSVGDGPGHTGGAGGSAVGGVGDVRNSGGAGSAGSGDTYADGGQAAGYTAGQSGADLRGGHAGGYGLGGLGDRFGGPANNPLGGGLRIMWGPDRAFPGSAADV